MTTTATTLARHISRREQTALRHIVGVDLGNRTSLLVDGQQATQIPSLISRNGNLAALLSARAGAGATGNLEAGEYVVEHGGITYYAGALALSQDATGATSGSADVSRYYNGTTLISLMALVGATYPGDVRLKVVTGVPPALLDDQPTIKRQISEHLIGNHHFTFHSSAGSRDVLMNVERVLVLAEGAAALAVYGTPNEPCGVLDIGWHTADVAWFDRHSKIVKDKSGSLPGAGMERVGEVLSQSFRRRSGRALQADEIAYILDEYVAGRTATIYHRGKHEITPGDVQEAIRVVTPAIANFLMLKWGGKDGSVAADAAVVLLIGGGPLFFEPKIDTLVKRFDQPQEQNARAYAAFAGRVEQLGKWPAVEV